MGLALRQTDVPGLIRINLMPPELVAQARNARRIPYFIVGAAGLLAALGLGIVLQNRERDAAKAQLEYVQEQNSAIDQKEQRLKAAQAKAKAELANCDSLQKLMRGRTAVLERVRAVRESLLPGMWISKWEHVAPSPGEGGEESLDGVKIVVCGWKDLMGAELAKWKANLSDSDEDRAKKGSNYDVSMFVKDKIKSHGIVASVDDDADADPVKVDLQTGPTLEEITLTFKFAPAASVDPNPPARKKQNRRGRK